MLLAVFLKNQLYHAIVFNDALSSMIFWGDLSVSLNA
jgi:hypothetical protein